MSSQSLPKFMYQHTKKGDKTPAISLQSEENAPINTGMMSKLATTNCCTAFKRTCQICHCCSGKKKKKDEHTWQKNVKTLTVTNQPIKSACNIWTTSYDATATVTAGEVINNHNMEKNERTSFQHWLTAPPNGIVHPYFPQPDVEKISTVISNVQFCETIDKSAEDAWYFSGIFTQENPPRCKEVTEL